MPKQNWSIPETIQQQQQQQISQTKETLKLVGQFHDHILTVLEKDVENFKGGNIRYFSKIWYRYTKDKYILDIITNGMKLDLKQLPTQNSRSSYPISNKENEVISVEIKKLLKKLVIVYSTLEEGEFISDIFTRDKKDGNKRMILNLKKINKFVNYKHFQMESINNIVNLIKPNVYMASTDLKDAFFSVPIHYDHQKYLKFIFGNLFQFTSMPNGYGPAMRIVTKISKVQFGHLRNQGRNSVVYVDDSYLQGDTYQGCFANIVDNRGVARIPQV